MAANIDRNRRIMAMRVRGIGPREIARRLEVSPCVVAGVLHRCGLTKEPRGRGHGATEAFKAAVLADLASGKSWDAVAASWGVSVASLSNWRQAA